MDPKAVPASPSTPPLQTQALLPKTKSNHLGITLGIIAFTLVALISGFIAGRVSAPKEVSPPAPAQIRTAAPEPEPIFDSQTASVLGEITNISGSTLTIKNSQGQTGNFPVSANVVISRFDTQTKQATSSSGLTALEIGKQANITLRLRDNRYEVTSILYTSTEVSAITPPFDN